MVIWWQTGLATMFAAIYAARAAAASTASVGASAPQPLVQLPAQDASNQRSQTSPAQTLGECFATVLQGQITTNKAGDLTRKTGTTRAYTFANRKRKTPLPTKPLPPLTSMTKIMDGSAFAPSKKQRVSDTISDHNCLEEMGSYSCCTADCHKQWGEEALERARSSLPRYTTGTQTARKTYVRECFSDEDHQLHIKDGLNAIPVCWRFYSSLMGVSSNLINSAGGVGAVHMVRRDAVDTAADLIAVWLEDLAKNWELQPDKNEIHMSYPTATMVYNMFCASSAVANFRRAPPVYAYFILVWNRDCPHIKLKKAMRFTKCDVCTLANEALDAERRKGGSGWLTPEMGIIKRNLEDHYEDVKKTRRVYMTAKQRSVSTPENILCIAIDGSDQSSYATPYFRQETKDTCKGWKMRMKLIGALVTGRMCMFYTLGSNWESGSNLTVQVLHSTLIELTKSLKEGQRLPRILHLQMDNCSRENKNRIFLAYLHVLVYSGVFDVIELHFGLKGHTHDEIDQVFSRVAVALRKMDAATRRLLGLGILSSYRVGQANFHVALQHLNNCGNLRDLLVGHMYPIPAVTKPQAFKVSKDPTDGRVKMQVQARSYRDDWGVIDRKGEYSEGYMTIMKSWPDLRDMPDHPRKSLDDNTLHQHRLCIESSEKRIKNYCHSVGTLPEGFTADQYYAQLMGELAESVIDVGKSTPVPFDWDLSLYDLPEPIDESALSGVGASRLGLGEGAGGAGPTPTTRGDGVTPTSGDRTGGRAGATGASPAEHGGGGGERGAGGRGGAAPTPATAPLFRVEVGEFVAFAQPKNVDMAVCVGKVLKIKQGVDGDEVELHWYMPKTVDPNTPRSKYGRAGWCPEFRMVDGKRVTSTSCEHVAAISCKFSSLTRSTKLPSHVWSSVEESEQAQDAEE